MATTTLQINQFDTDNINADDLFLVGDSLIDIKGLISHHIESANNFYKNGIMPNNNGWIEQTNKFNEVMLFIDNKINEHQKEQNGRKWIKTCIKPCR